MFARYTGSNGSQDEHIYMLPAALGYLLPWVYVHESKTTQKVKLLQLKLDDEIFCRVVLQLPTIIIKI